MPFFSVSNNKRAMKWVACAIAISLLFFYIMIEDSDDYGYCMVSEGGESTMHVLKTVLRTLYRAVFTLCHK